MEFAWNLSPQAFSVYRYICFVNVFSSRKLLGYWEAQFDPGIYGGNVFKYSDSAVPSEKLQVESQLPNREVWKISKANNIEGDLILLETPQSSVLQFQFEAIYHSIAGREFRTFTKLLGFALALFNIFSWIK